MQTLPVSTSSKCQPKWQLQPKGAELGARKAIGVPGAESPGQGDPASHRPARYQIGSSVLMSVAQPLNCT